MNLQQMRDLVRTQLDLDDTDLPDILLDAFLQEGYDRVISLEQRWPFFEMTWQITVDETGVGTLPVGVRVIELLSVNGIAIPYVDMRYLWSAFGPSPVVGAYGSCWTVSNRTLIVQPPIGAASTANARGYRMGSDWIAVGASSECDCDRRLHIPICWYAASLGYAQQEDEVLEATYQKRFNESSALARDAIMRTWTGSPKRMSYTSYPHPWGGPGRQPHLIFQLPSA